MRGIYLLSVWLHVVAAATWVGGMILFVAAVMPALRRQDDAARSAFLAWFGPRFRLIARICLGVLVLTGTFNLWMRGVRASDIGRPEWWSSSFAHVLALKLSLVLLAVIVTIVHESAATRARARWLGRLSLVLGLSIVAAAVLLVRSI